MGASNLDAAGLENSACLRELQQIRPWIDPARMPIGEAQLHGVVADRDRIDELCALPPSTGRPRNAAERQWVPRQAARSMGAESA